MLKKTMYAVATAAALCAVAFNAEAKTQKSSTAAPAKTEAKADAEATSKTSSRPIPFYGTIGKVDKANKTFTIEGKKSTRTFTATESTKLDKGGVAATWNDILPGEYVRGSAMKTGESSYTAMSIKLGPKEKTASAAEPESKSKKR